MNTVTKAVSVTAVFNCECCHEQCPNLKMRDAGRGIAYRCKWLDVKLNGCDYAYYVAYRNQRCIELFGHGDDGH